MEIERILYQPKFNVAYLHNPKVACSTIKNSLLEGKENNVHAQFLFPPYNNVSVPIFSMVRNPYNRIISAFLDKVGPNKDDYVWLPFSNQFNLDNKKNITFNYFLNLLNECEDKNLIDHHFRPQHLNLLSEYITPEFIGYIEDISSVKDYMESKGIPFLNRAPHKTKSKEMAEKLLTEKNISLINNIYQKDFTTYGYSEDPHQKNNLRPIINKQKVSPKVAFEHKKIHLNRSVEVIRDSAILLETIDIYKSYELMRIAQSLRPLGDFINKKVEQYQNEISKKEMN